MDGYCGHGGGSGGGGGGSDGGVEDGNGEKSMMKVLKEDNSLTSKGFMRFSVRGGMKRYNKEICC